ncbi:GatB/YqeY domain-containing protein [soil metagenome]
MIATTMKEKIRNDLNDARRERDKLRTVVLSTMLADIRNREIEAGKEIGDEEVSALVTTSIKRRREAAEQMRAGNREDLAVKEEQEATILQAYLPPQLSEDEVRAIVRSAIDDGANDLGSIMKAILPQVKGLFEGRETNRIVREELALQS